MLGSILTGGALDDRADWPALWASATAHRVHLLVADRLSKSRDAPAGALAIRSAMDTTSREAALVEMAQARELRRILAALADRQVRAIVFKGAALAYTCYPAPHLRPRLDVDLFIDESDIARMQAVMIDAGYHHDPTVSGRMVIPQRHYERVTASGQDLFDVHWRLANVPAFAEALSFEELAASAMPVPALGPSARAASDMHALFIACLHRVAHHHDADDLIWLYDIHLLAARLTDDEWRAFTALASSTNMRTVCRHSLQHAERELGTIVPAAVGDALANAPAEASAAFLGPSRPRRTLDIELANLRGLHGWRDRLSFAREHIFPPADYILARYGRRQRAWLPALYLHRLITGGAKWLTDRKPV